MAHPILNQSAEAAADLADGPRIVLVSAMKNEAPFVLEWVAYHKVIGIDQIVICANPSTDGTDDLLAALAKAGEVVHLPTAPSPGTAPQAAAVQAFEKGLGYREGDWYLWLDADEFLNVHVGDRTAAALVAAIGPAAGAMLNWRIFGANGHARFPGRFISNDFPQASERRFVANLETKPLFRHSSKVTGFAPDGISRPRVAPDAKLTAADFVGGNGKALIASEDRTIGWLAGTLTGRTNLAARKEFGWELAQINHYSVRTPEFFELKKTRGRGTVATGPKRPNARHTDGYFHRFDRNEVEDRSILHWQDAVTAEIDRLLAEPAIAHAVDRSVRAVAEHLGVAEPAALPIMQNDRKSGNVPAPARPRRVLFSAMTNEAPFLLEWIAYHKLIGFDEIVICSSPSTDGTEELLASLATHGEITHLRAIVPAGEQPRFAATTAFAQSKGFVEGDWYLWLDADEFLNVHVGDRTLDALLGHLDGKQFALINWRVFGSSGQKQFGGRFIDPAFTGASSPKFDRNLAIKSIFRHSPAILGFARYGTHRPLIARGSTLQLADVMMGNGQPPSPEGRLHGRWLRGIDTGKINQVPVEEFGWSLAQINRYIVRTPEFFALGRAQAQETEADREGEANDRHSEVFFFYHDRNEETDDSILFWRDRVTDELNRLMDLPEVLQAAETSKSLVSALLDQVEPELPLNQLIATPAATTGPFAPFELTFPDEEQEFLEKSYAEATSILEYGSGGSTILAAINGKAVVSVESDLVWASGLAKHIADLSDTARIHYVNIGPTGDWGMPLRAKSHGLFHRYALSVWDRPDFQQPDLVLIDGRFRAACLAAVMLRATRPTTVLFDDYAARRYYHGVERLARKEETIGRMARFTVTPGPIPPDLITEVVGWFADPR